MFKQQQFESDLMKVSELLRSGGYDDLLITNSQSVVFNMSHEGQQYSTGFNGTGEHACGTACCIAGLLHVIHFTKAYNDACEEMMEFYGAERDTAEYDVMDDLFFPYECGLDWTQIRPTQAADVIDHYLKTREVDWSIINE